MDLSVAQKIRNDLSCLCIADVEKRMYSLVISNVRLTYYTHNRKWEKQMKKRGKKDMATASLLLLLKPKKKTTKHYDI